jgi:two-component system cell cycle sensor histidine kinase/response regulator CckA
MTEQPLVGVYLIEGNRFRFVNDRFAKILGYTPDELTRSVSVAEVIHDDDREVVLERMRSRLEGGEGSVDHRFRVVQKDGGAVPVEVWGRGVEWQGAPAIAGVMIDHSSHQVLAKQLRRSQKLESIGEFTGAVAHDFNNVLTAIIAPVQLALDDLAEGDPLRAQLEEIELAADRGASLSRQLLAFSRKQVVESHPHDLNRIIEGVEGMLRRLVGAGVRVEMDLAQGLHTVVIDATQVEQVLVNLVVNAKDAMQEGGTLRITTQNPSGSGEPMRSGGNAPPLGYVVLTVEDTGHGFDEDVRARIFDPYYTTKSEGTGLGLSTVFGIASQAGGFVRVTSAPGAGATFKIFLPASDRVPKPVRVEAPASRTLVRGTERVLVVEDQDPVRHVIVRALTRFGYSIVETSNAEDAIEQYDDLDPQPDLLLTDVRLEGRSGPDMVRVLRERQPDLRVLYISGLADDDVFDTAADDEDWYFLAKPFSIEGLLDKVRRALDGPEQSDREGHA